MIYAFAKSSFRDLPTGRQVHDLRESETLKLIKEYSFLERGNKCIQLINNQLL